MTVMMYIQPSTVNGETPADILAPLAGKFDAITTYQSGNQVAVDALFDAAQTAGFETYIWLSPGYPYGTLPNEWNLNYTVSGYSNDWAALHLEAARTGIFNYWTGIAQHYVDEGNLDGVQLDYIRYRYCDIVDFSDDLAAADVTATVQLFRTWANARSLSLVASVMNGHPHTCSPAGLMPFYTAHGQEWPDWVDDSLIDVALIMSYDLNYWDDPDFTWADQPTTTAALASQRVVLDPAGTSADDNPTPANEAAYDQEVTWAANWGYPKAPSVFDWGLVDDATRWSWIDDMADWPAPAADSANIKLSAVVYISADIRIN